MHFVTSIIGAVVALALLAEPAHATCVDHCGGRNEAAYCWCDQACYDIGDCCRDMTTACERPEVTGLDADFTAGILRVIGERLTRHGLTTVSVGDAACPLLTSDDRELTCTLPRALVGAGHAVVVTKLIGGLTLTGASSAPLDYPSRVGVSYRVSPSAMDSHSVVVAADSLGLGIRPALHLGDATVEMTTHHCDAIVCYHALIPAPTRRHTSLSLSAGDTITPELAFVYEPPVLAQTTLSNGVITTNGRNIAHATFTLGGRPCVDVASAVPFLRACRPDVWDDGALVAHLPDGESSPVPLTFPEPRVTATNSTTLAARGGESLVIEGQWLGAAVSVVFGDTLVFAHDVSGERATVRTPPGPWGPTSVALHTRGRVIPIAGLAYAPPVVQTISPGSGYAQARVTLTGTGFGTTPQPVWFGTRLATLESWSDTHIVVLAPDGEGLASVALGGYAQTATFLHLRRVPVGEPPRVTAMTPTSGGPGTRVVVTGSALGQARVSVGGIAAAIVPASAGELAFVVPVGQGSAAPVILERDDHAVLAGTFTYERPVIAAIEGDGATLGHRLIIRGRGFGPAPSVRFDGAPVHVSSAGPEHIEAHIAPGGGAGHVVTIQAGDQLTSAPWSYARPVVTSISTDPTGGWHLFLDGTNLHATYPVPLDLDVGGHDCVVTHALPTLIRCRMAQTYFPHGQPVTLSVAGLAPEAPLVMPTVAPILHAHEPGRLAPGGGEVMTLWGNYLGGEDVQVTIGDLPCLDPVVVHERVLRCTTPPGVGASELRVVVDGRAKTGIARHRDPTILGVPHTPTSGGPMTFAVADLSPAHPFVVALAGVPLEVIAHDEGEVTVMVPPGAGEDLTLTLTQGATASAALSYAAPSVSTIAPRDVVAGTIVQLDGTGFGPSGAVSVRVGEHVCPIVMQSHTRIACVVPTGSATTEVYVKVLLREVLAGTVEYPRPRLDAPSPSQGIAGEPLLVTLTGAGFGPLPFVEHDGDPVRVYPQGPDRLVLVLPPDDGVGHTLQLFANGHASNVVTIDYVAPPPPIVDGDHDGVADADDACPDTGDEPVLPDEGCGPTQLCPCAGPSGVGSAWHDHHAYVECVAAALTELVAAEVIDRDAAEAIEVDAEQAGCGVDPCADHPLVMSKAPAPKLALRVVSYAGPAPLRVYLGTTRLHPIGGVVHVPLTDASGKVVTDPVTPSNLDGQSSIPSGAIVLMRRGQGDVAAGVKGAPSLVSAELEATVTAGRLGTVRALSLEPDDTLWQAEGRYTLTTHTTATHDLVGHRVCR